MSTVRTVNIKGNPKTLAGNEVKVGDKAPDFQVVGTDWKPTSLSDFAGKVVILSSILSVETGICDMETKKFNEYATSLSDEIQIVTISADLPFSLGRWCGAAGVDKVAVLSDHHTTSFGTNYGVLIEDMRTLARALFVVDKEGIVRYVQLVEEIGTEPDYEAVINAAQELLD